MGVLPKIFVGSWGLRQISSESEAHCYVSADVSKWNYKAYPSGFVALRF